MELDAVKTIIVFQKVSVRSIYIFRVVGWRLKPDSVDTSLSSEAETESSYENRGPTVFAQNTMYFGDLP